MGACRAQRGSGITSGRPVPVTAVSALGISVAAGLLSGSGHLNDAGARAGIETAITIWTCLAAGLLLFQFSRTGCRRDLVLFAALSATSLTDFAWYALPTLTGSVSDVPDGLRLGTSVLVALAFAAAAFVHNRRIPENSRKRAAITAFGGLAMFTCLQVADFPLGPDFDRAWPGAHAPHWPLVVLTVTAAAIFVLAGLGFLTRRETRQRHSGLIATASFLLASARLQYLWLPVVPAQWVTSREIVRLCGCSLLLTVAIKEQFALHRRAARAAIEAERQRLARDLHDGLAQDLAVIALHGQRLETELGFEHPLAVAARRALAVSRGQMLDLAASHAPTTLEALEQVADELSKRFGIVVDVRAADMLSHRADAHQAAHRDAIVRIAREAVVNSARHGRSSRVLVELGSGERGLVLRVTDDGCGIGRVVATSSGLSGFGLPAMQERAKSIGASLVAHRNERGGTSVEVMVS